MNLNNLMKLYNNQLFDEITIPDGLDQEVLVNQILMKCALSEPMYTEFELLKDMINHFFKVNYPIYKRLYEAFELEYNPIENYDRKEDVTITNNANSTNESINQLNSYDSNEFTNRSKDTDAGSSDYTTITTGRLHGNIGVTTTQQMLESEMKVRKLMNIYEIIASDFYKTFMLFI